MKHFKYTPKSLVREGHELIIIETKPFIILLLCMRENFITVILTKYEEVYR